MDTTMNLDPMVRAATPAIGKQEFLVFRLGNQDFGIAEMDQVTQQNAALVEEAAPGAESLQEQAGNLAQVVGVFKLEGASADAAAPVADPVPRPAASVVQLPQKRISAQQAPEIMTSPSPVRNVANAKVGSAEEWQEF